MQKISAPNLQPGMIVARNIYSGDGLLLLNSGMKLTESFIDRLKKLGISSIYIENPYLGEIEIPEAVREETRMRAIGIVQKSFDELKMSSRLNIQQFKQAADDIVNDLLASRQAMIHLSDIRSHDNYTFGHSVNVCILSTITGLQLGYDIAKLKNLALGALLHDAGKALVPLELLNKPGRLTDEEMTVMRKHSEIGFDILRAQLAQVPLPAAHVAFQHHEKMDGSGYPRGLKGEAIHEYAKIAAIADVYDALTADRPYRERMPAHEAYELVVALANSHFDTNILTTFLSNVAVYPIGSFISLNTGQIGIVTNVIPKLPTRPTVRIITDADGKHLSNPYEIDLTENLTWFVVKVLSEKEILEQKFI